MTRYYLGVDPGLSGALAFYDPNTNDLIIHDMPVHEIVKNKKTKRQLDLYQLGILMDSMANVTKHAFIEAPSAMPGQGVTSSFAFGFGCGCAQMVVAANLIPMTLYAPAVWKKAMGLSSSKDEARRMASMLMPKHAKLWPLKKDDGKAESALLAYLGAKKYASS